MRIQLPTGAVLLVAGAIAIETHAGQCRAYCRPCGRELAAWPSGTGPPALRCQACRPSPRALEVAE